MAIRVTAAPGEDLPYERVLRGQDATTAAGLEKRVEELQAAGKFADAIAPAREVLVLRERAQGQNHWQVADARRQVQTLERAASFDPAMQQELLQANRKQTQGDRLFADDRYAGNAKQRAGITENWSKAASLHREALGTYRKLFGDEHPQSLTAANKLVMDLALLHKYSEAEKRARETLSTRKRILGEDHPATAESYKNLAMVLNSLNRQEEVVPLCKQALSIRLRVLGVDHPDTAQSYNNLAVILAHMGRFKEAEVIFRQELPVCRKVHGEDAISTAMTYQNLALALFEQGKYAEAEVFCRTSMAICQKVGGNEHPGVAMGYQCLADILSGQGRHAEASPLFEKSLALRKVLRGEEHPVTADGYTSLATNLDELGESRKAEPLFRQALEINRKKLGEDAPETARAYDDLGVNLNRQGRYTEATEYLDKALALRRQQGDNHPDLAHSYVNVAGNLADQGQRDQAAGLYEKAIEIRQKVSGSQHPDTVVAYDAAAKNAFAMARWAEAAALWKKAVDGFEVARLRSSSVGFERAYFSARNSPRPALAACLARDGQATEAWLCMESGLARSILDEEIQQASLRGSLKVRDRERTILEQLDAAQKKVTELLGKPQRTADEGKRLDEAIKQRHELEEELGQLHASQSAKEVCTLGEIQSRLRPDEAMITWVDLPQERGPVKRDANHWACVLRSNGPPVWIGLQGSGSEGSWSESDDTLPRQVHNSLAHGEADVSRNARRLAAQRLDPLASHLAASAQLPAVRRLVIVPAGRLAAVPIEALAEQYLVSYAPSGTVFSRLRAKHRSLVDPSLLALGNPNFNLPTDGPSPELPAQGLYLSLVRPDGNAGRNGLRTGDVLLSYNNVRLTKKSDLKNVEEGAKVPAEFWRNGRTDTIQLDPGKLGVAISDDPPGVAYRKRGDAQLLADARTRSGADPLPGTGLEASGIANLLPPEHVKLLLGSEASEQRLDELADRGRLKDWRLIHFATHGKVDMASFNHSYLLMARDRLPGPDDQLKLAADAKKVPTGRLSVEMMARQWQLDADLVTLSACETGLGPEGGGDGLLGFSQVLLARGARSLLLSLWKVDDTATALLMTRFYRNLLGKRDDLEKPLPKAEALREAKVWLKGLSRNEVERLAGELANGEVRGTEEPKAPAQTVNAKATIPAGDLPYAHPRFWAAFILIGDPD